MDGRPLSKYLAGKRSSTPALVFCLSVRLWSKLNATSKIDDVFTEHGGGVVAHEILVSAQGPLVFGFLGLGLRGLGPGLDNIKFTAW